MSWLPRRGSQPLLARCHPECEMVLPSFGYLANYQTLGAIVQVSCQSVKHGKIVSRRPDHVSGTARGLHLVPETSIPPLIHPKRATRWPASQYAEMARRDGATDRIPDVKILAPFVNQRGFAGSAGFPVPPPIVMINPGVARTGQPTLPRHDPTNDAPGIVVQMFCTYTRRDMNGVCRRPGAEQ